jgi:acyl phosphate:glycerol-3-phosphate acyltransferase
VTSSTSPLSIAPGRKGAGLAGAASAGLASIALGFGAGSIPFSNVVARWRAGVDLRTVGSGTVSGTGLYEVAGTGPLIAVGLFELAKGAVGPLLAGRRHPVMAALAGAAAVAGHNWSPLLRGAGGRGISPAVGALLVNAPAGSGVLLAGLALGKLGGETALGSFIADLVLVPVSARVHGRRGRASALAVLVPIVAKRLMGNGPPLSQARSVYLYRLVFDRDTREKPGTEVLNEAHTSNEPGGPKPGSLETGPERAAAVEGESN